MAGFLAKGLGSIKEQADKSVGKLKIEIGKPAEIRVLTPADEIIGIYEHTVQIGGQWKTATCLGKGVCPLCVTGDRASFKAYLCVLDRTDNRVKYWKISKTVALQLYGLVEEYGDLSARDFKVSRQGEKLQTTYQFFPRDPKEEDLSQFELPNLEELVKPMTREAMIAMMSGGISANQNNEQQQEQPSGDKDSKSYPF